MWKPKYFHEMITNSVSITMSVSPSQSWMSALETDALQARVDEGVGLQEQAEDDAGDRLGQHVRDEEQQPEDRASREPPVEQDGERRARTGSGATSDRTMTRTLLPTRLPEHVARQRHLVVLEADEVGRAGRGRSTCTG